MAERYTGKRKLKKSFLIVSETSKFIKNYRIEMLLAIVLIVGATWFIIWLLKPGPTEKIQQGVEFVYEEAKADIKNVWGGISGFFGNIGDGITGGFAAIGDFFERLF